MFYGVVILGMVLGGLVLLVLYSLLAMAQKGDEFYDQLEMEQPRAREYAPPVSKRVEPENLGAPATFDLDHGGAT
jgi:hypothetical protein